MLKSAGASEKAIQLGKDLKCSVCMSRQKKSHPDTKAKQAEGFNQQVRWDTFDVSIYNGKPIKMLNMICEGTALQVVVPLWQGAKAKEVRRAYRKYQIRWGGVCRSEC